jgi:hypothetical protein
MFKVVKVPAAASAGKIAGTISLLSFAPIMPILNVGEPTTTIVAEEGEEDSTCCEGTEVELSALLLLLTTLPLPSTPLRVVEEDTVPGGRTSTTTPVATDDPLLLTSILNGLTTPGLALMIFDKPGCMPCVLLLPENAATAEVLRITLPLSRNGILSVVDLVSSSSCSSTLK